MLLLSALLGCEGTEAEAKESPVPGNGKRFEKVMLQPLGPIAESDVKFVADALSSYFNFEIVIQEKQDLPKMAWYAPRKRYRADSLLRYLGRNRSVGYDRIIGLTAKDISTTKGEYKDYGIMGLGQVPGRACILSTYRMRKGTTDKQFHDRMRRVARHEVGHTLGLLHCEDPACLMRDANGKASTVDQASDDMCQRCSYLVQRYLRGEVLSSPQ